MNASGWAQRSEQFALRKELKRSCLEFSANISNIIILFFYSLQRELGLVALKKGLQPSTFREQNFGLIQLQDVKQQWKQDIVS